MKKRDLLLAVLCGGMLFACSNSSGSAPTFNLMFEAPGGSGLAGGDGGNYTYSPSHTVDFDLRQGVTVSGQVTDGGGTPLVGVTVSFRATAASPSVDGDGTDGTGNYSVTLPEGTWVAVLEPQNPSLGTLMVSGIVVTAPGPVTRDFQFPAQVAVTGSVFESGGPPIAGALLDWTGSQTGASALATADGAGMYTVNLVPDTYDVVVTPVGGAATTELKQTFRGIVVTVAMARDFTLTRGVQVSGVVREDTGTPLLENTDIEVILADGSDFFPPPGVTTNPADGTYGIGPVPPGSVTFELEAPGDSGFPRQRITRTVFAGTSQTEDFNLARGFVLSGTVFQDDGTTPEDNVDVEPMPTDGSLPPDSDTTDNSGMYEISVFPGAYDVTFMPTTVNGQLPEVRSLSITQNTVLNVTLARGVVVSGTVFQPDGTTPEPDVRVEIQGVLGASAVSDGSGNYSFLAPPGTHTFHLTATGGTFEDFALQPVTGIVVTAPGPVAQDLTMALASTGSTVVQGTVFQPDGTTPVQGAMVTARDNTTGDVRGRATTDASGSYVLVIQ